jgi:hypothetical protein
MIPNIAVQLRLRPKPRANDLAFWTRINPVTRRSRMRARRTYKTIRAMSDAGSGTSIKPKAATASSVSETIAAHITNIRALRSYVLCGSEPDQQTVQSLVTGVNRYPGGETPWADDTSDCTQPMVSSVMVGKYHNLLETWMVDAATLRPRPVELSGPAITATLSTTSQLIRSRHHWQSEPARYLANLMACPVQVMLCQQR